jgi:hypothetical protein
MKIKKGREAGIDVLQISWNSGELENLTADIRNNRGNLENLKPENAIKILRLHALYQMGDSVYRMLGSRVKCRFPGSSILSQDNDIPDNVMSETDLHLAIFGGTQPRDRGLILWQLLNAINKAKVLDELDRPELQQF